MGVLARLGVAGALAALASCYSPDLHDCVVACTGASDCAPDQVCGGDGYCASPDVAGSCAALLRPDAHDHGHAADARDVDAQPMASDADATVAMRVVVVGLGKVKLDGAIHAECESTTDAGTSCTIGSVAGAMVTLSAGDGHGWHFAGWSDPSCGGGMCHVLLGPGTTTITATFDLP